MKIMLINPSQYDEFGKPVKFRRGTFAPTGLLLLAERIKRMGRSIEVKIVDACVDDIPYDEK